MNGKVAFDSFEESTETQGDGNITDDTIFSGNEKYVADRPAFESVMEDVSIMKDSSADMEFASKFPDDWDLLPPNMTVRRKHKNV